LVLNPLHPPNRLDEVRPGQHWRMPLVGSLPILEALAHALDALDQNQSLDRLIEKFSTPLASAFDHVHFLEASVAPHTQPLPVDDPKRYVRSGPPECLVIEARDDESQAFARLWIDRGGGPAQGLVLRQEVTLHGANGDDVWIVNREP
jgi:hypothetical protein